MTSEQLFEDVRFAAYAAGVSIRALCAEAQVAPVTVWRWKNGKAAPTASTYDKLISAAGRLQKSKQKAQ